MSVFWPQVGHGSDWRLLQLICHTFWSSELESLLLTRPLFSFTRCTWSDPLRGREASTQQLHVLFLPFGTIVVCRVPSEMQATTGCHCLYTSCESLSGLHNDPPLFKKTMSSSCSEVKTDFVLCILRSPCYLEHPASNSDKSNEALQHCLHNPDLLPESCQHQRTALFECKKAMVCVLTDLRARQVRWLIKHIREDSSMQAGGSAAIPHSLPAHLEATSRRRMHRRSSRPSAITVSYPPRSNQHSHTSFKMTFSVSTSLNSLPY